MRLPLRVNDIIHFRVFYVCFTKMLKNRSKSKEIHQNRRKIEGNLMPIQTIGLKHRDPPGSATVFARRVGNDDCHHTSLLGPALWNVVEWAYPKNSQKILSNRREIEGNRRKMPTFKLFLLFRAYTTNS